MSYLHYLCLFAHRSDQHIICFSFVCLHLVYPMLTVSMDCPFLIAPSVFSNVYFVYIQYIHLVVNIYYLVHKMNIMERMCQQRWPTIPLSLQITEHKNTIFADGNPSTGIGHVQICGGAKTENEISLFPFSAISRLTQLTSGHCWLILGSMNMCLFYHCSSSFKSGHTYSTIQWNALNLLTCWESVSVSRVFYCHWGKKN